MPSSYNSLFYLNLNSKQERSTEFQTEMRVLWVFRNKTPPIFFIPSVFLAYGYLDLYDRPQLLYPLLWWSAGVCGYLQVSVGIEDDITRATRKFPHPIKIEDILSLDDDIFRKTRNTCPYKNRGYIGYTSLYILQQCHVLRISGMLEKLREMRHLSIES